MIVKVIVKYTFKWNLGTFFPIFYGKIDTDTLLITLISIFFLYFFQPRL